MKNVKNLFFAVVIMIAATVSAQAQKIAHINVQELIGSMPEYKASVDQLKKMNEGYDRDFKKMVDEFQTKMKKYQEEAPTAGDATNDARQKEMQEAESRIQKFQQNAQTELSQKTEQLQVPILEKAQKAIHKVARAKGYEFVLDSTIGSGVILADGPNLLDDVKKELNIK